MAHELHISISSIFFTNICSVPMFLSPVSHIRGRLTTTILVVLPVFNEANLNTQSQSDISQSRWIYCIYCECLECLDCPVDTLLPGNIMDNVLQSLCTSLLTHGLQPGVQEWNLTAGKHGQVPSFVWRGPGLPCTRCYSEPTAPAQSFGARRWPGNGNRAAKPPCETAGHNLSTCFLHAILAQQKGR